VSSPPCVEHLDLLGVRDEQVVRRPLPFDQRVEVESRVKIFELRLDPDARAFDLNGPEGLGPGIVRGGLAVLAIILERDVRERFGGHARLKRLLEREVGRGTPRRHGLVVGDGCRHSRRDREHHDRDQQRDATLTRVYHVGISNRR
jgi:hypothetical protein